MAGHGRPWPAVAGQPGMAGHGWAWLARTPSHAGQNGNSSESLSRIWQSVASLITWERRGWAVWVWVGGLVGANEGWMVIRFLGNMWWKLGGRLPAPLRPVVTGRSSILSWARIITLCYSLIPYQITYGLLDYLSGWAGLIHNLWLVTLLIRLGRPEDGPGPARVT